MEKSTKYPPNTKLRTERIRRNWTQVQAEVKAELPPGSLGRWERGDVFPEAYARERLCVLYNKSAEELGFLEQEAPSLPQQPLTEAVIANDEVQTTSLPPVPPQSAIDSKSSVPRRYRVVIGVIVGLVLASTLGLFGMHFLRAGYPGGQWISPANGAIVHDMLHVAVYAYPWHNGEPAIAYVNVTLAWEGSDPHQWLVACHLTAPVRTDIFQCDVQLRQLGVPAGRVRVSFDVYDQVGNMHNAPNGIHDVVYIPTGLPRLLDIHLS